MLVNAADMLKKAEAGKYALGAFNTNNLEWTLAILQAAEEAKSPLILQCTAGAAKWMGGFKVCADMVKAAVEATGVTVPVALHLDHGSYEDCFKCIEAGFTSIMYDGSHEETFQLNLDRTKELVELAHSKGMSIEAEVGGIGGTEDGVTSSGELADPAECKQIADLGVDFLACGIGNIHGVYPADWAGLSFERLGEIKAETGRPAPRSARWHRHPRGSDQEGHLPGYLQDQRQHRPAARLRQGRSRVHRGWQGSAGQGL